MSCPEPDRLTADTTEGERVVQPDHRTADNKPGDLEPGMRARHRDLAAQFGVSVTPVGAARQGPAHQGLTDARPDAADRASRGESRTSCP